MTRIRTSINSPLRIDAINLDRSGGVIGMTLCPGKQGDSQFGAQWARDLKTDLEVIRQWGASTLVTVMESEELKMLGVGNLGEQATAAGLNWYPLPIVDGNVPDHRFNDVWPGVAGCLCSELQAGRKVAVHCRGGLGRTGMVACLLLTELGYMPGDALKQVRMARPGTVETAAQEAFVLAYQPRLKNT